MEKMRTLTFGNKITNVREMCFQLTHLQAINNMALRDLPLKGQEIKEIT